MEIKRFYSLEGNTQRLDGGAMFGNVPKTLWSQWIQPDENNCIPLSCRALLLHLEDGRYILFETGIGAFFSPKLKERFGVQSSNHQLLEALSAIGLSHTDIDIVILSHLHFDHAGGLLEVWQESSEPALLFPKAEFWVGERQWNHARHPHFRDRASYIKVLPELLIASKRLVVLAEGAPHVLSDTVTFHLSDGHTPGMMMSEIVTKRGPIVFCGDLVPGASWVHLPVTMGYDRFPERLIDEKKQLLTYLLAHNGALFFTHDNTVVLGKVAQDSKERFYVEPADLEDYTT